MEGDGSKRIEEVSTLPSEVCGETRSGNSGNNPIAAS